MNKSFAKQVWENLSAIEIKTFADSMDVGNRKLSYLSWAKAWSLLMNEYPESYYSFEEKQTIEEAGLMIYCTVSIINDEGKISRTMWLPVMDNRNNAIVKPDERAISDTRMRCLVKCLAMFGLGISLYSKDMALPDYQPKFTQDEKDGFDDLFEIGNSYDLFMMSKQVGDQKWIDLVNSFPSGMKVKNKQLINEFLDYGFKHQQIVADQVKIDIAADNKLAVVEVAEEWSTFEKRWFLRHFDKHEKDYMTRSVLEARGE